MANLNEVITREFTIHLQKRILKSSFKKRAPTAIKAIKAFAVKAMGTSDVRVDPRLNKNIWSNGVHGVPNRVRVRMSRRRNEAEDAKSKMYTVVTYVPVASFSGLQHEVVDE